MTDSRSTEVAELENMVGIQDYRDCPMCSFNEPQIANLKLQRDTAELRANRFQASADREKSLRERWRFWFYIAALAFGLSSLRWMN